MKPSGYVPVFIYTSVSGKIFLPPDERSHLLFPYLPSISTGRVSIFFHQKPRRTFQLCGPRLSRMYCSMAELRFLCLTGEIGSCSRHVVDGSDREPVGWLHDLVAPCRRRCTLLLLLSLIPSLVQAHVRIYRAYRLPRRCHESGCFRCSPVPAYQYSLVVLWMSLIGWNPKSPGVKSNFIKGRGRREYAILRCFFPAIISSLSGDNVPCVPVI